MKRRGFLALFGGLAASAGLANSRVNASLPSAAPAADSKLNAAFLKVYEEAAARSIDPPLLLDKNERDEFAMSGARALSRKYDEERILAFFRDSS